MGQGILLAGFPVLLSETPSFPVNPRASVACVRRRIALLLVVVGIVAVVVGAASGCGRLFSFNGRHPVAVEPLVPGTPLKKTFTARADSRYTLAVQVVFEREGRAEANGALVVEAQLPLVASFEDSSGVAVAKVVGWLDPNEPPTVLYGQSANKNQRRPAGAPPTELVAERLVGPFNASDDRPVVFVVDLGADRIGKVPVKEARCVVYDDALPVSIRAAFAGAVGGGVALFSGVIMLLFGLRSRRRARARLSGARAT